MVRDQPMKTAPHTVAEMQGLYGPFSFPEKLLQKIWLRGDFDRAAAITTDGRRVRVVFPGRWNLLGGPDFIGARIRFDDGPVVQGDIELHLRADDWAAHGHARDAAYDGVILHVVLFVPAARHITAGAGGRTLPVLALLPLLHHDLEEFAADDAVETLADRPAARLTEELGRLPPETLATLLRTHAEARWREKVRFARLRVARLGWAAACHHTALEILGYRFNRAPMLRLAGAVPLWEWEMEDVDPEEIFAREAEGWSLQGFRPANHPRARVRQYAAWVRARPGWPARLAESTAKLPEISAGGATRGVRRSFSFTRLRAAWSDEICGDAVGGTRWANLVCDGFLPLLATRAESAPGFELWFHWFAGDLPPVVGEGLRGLGMCDGRVQPACHGLGQGLLGWLIGREGNGTAPVRDGNSSPGRRGA